MIKVKSSAKAVAKARGNSPLNTRAEGPSLMWCKMISIKRMNRRGARGHPCLTPRSTFMWTFFGVLKVVITLMLCNRFVTALMNHWGEPRP